MKATSSITAALVVGQLLAIGANLFAADPASTDAAKRVAITVDTKAAGRPVSPTLYGVFFEEINRAGDGGLYAEMIQNRSFEDASVPVAWTVVKGVGADVSIALDKTQPLNTNNPTSLRLDITKADSGARAGIANEGFKGTPEEPHGKPQEWMPKFENAARESTSGIAVEVGKEYILSLYARSGHGFHGPLTVSVEKQDGTVLASQQIASIDEAWKKFECRLTASSNDENARLVIAANAPGTLWLDMVSLFPKDTFKNRSNGLRADLAQKIADMHPAFVRFPGGCYVEGDEIENAFRWKKSVGDIAERPGHWDLWGYYSTDGLGYYEYLQFCEDIGAEPLYVTNVGMSHHDGKLNAYAVPMDKMQEYVQDALDAIEYANGPITSKWGSLRAKAGHPEPFHLKFMEIGNENGGPAYDERYALFYDAIKRRYPEMRLVACKWEGIPKSRPVEILDEHYYETPEFFMRQASRYDSYDRKGPNIYVGEYAVTIGAGRGNLRAAIGEAAFMTGMERNGDIVAMASYAPLLERVGWRHWNPNAILYDALRSYGTPSYYVQAMFGANRADVSLPTSVEAAVQTPVSTAGKISVGTWATQAEFKDIKVTSANGAVLYQSNFSKGLDGFQRTRGAWEIKNSALRQTSPETDTCAIAGDSSWKDYTLTLKARKLSGAEGFFISFDIQEDGARCVWNLGGWGNTDHGLELPNAEPVRVPGKIETNRWYDVRIELKGQKIRCYLDGKLIQDVVRQDPPTVFAVAGRKGGELILKIVNTRAEPQETTINLKGAGTIAPGARAVVLTSSNDQDENSFDAPTRVTPSEEVLNKVAGTFQRTLPGNSVTILRMKF
jgi:alpha-L-arabinofuranosidase